MSDYEPKRADDKIPVKLTVLDDEAECTLTVSDIKALKRVATWSKSIQVMVAVAVAVAGLFSVLPAIIDFFKAHYKP